VDPVRPGGLAQTYYRQLAAINRPSEGLPADSQHLRGLGDGQEHISVGRSQPRSRASERSTESRHSEHTPSTGYSMRSAGRRHPRGVACGGSWRCAQGRQASAGHALSLRQGISTP
jgi:hypothetical protein